MGIPVSFTMARIASGIPACHVHKLSHYSRKLRTCATDLGSETSTYAVKLVIWVLLKYRTGLGDAPACTPIWDLCWHLVRIARK